DFVLALEYRLSEVFRAARAVVACELGQFGESGNVAIGRKLGHALDQRRVRVLCFRLREAGRQRRPNRARLSPPSPLAEVNPGGVAGHADVELNAFVLLEARKRAGRIQPNAGKGRVETLAAPVLEQVRRPI